MERISILPNAAINKSGPEFLGARARQALLDYYPALYPFEHHLPTEVYFGTYSELQGIEKTDICLETLPVYRGIRNLLPKDSKNPSRPNSLLVDHLERVYLTVRSESHPYCNPERGEIYLPYSLLDHIRRGDPYALQIYNYNLLDNFLRILAYRVNPHAIREERAFFGRYMMRDESLGYIQSLEDFMEDRGIKKAFRIGFRLDARNFFTDISSEAEMVRNYARFVAVGGKIIYVAGEQIMVQSEASIGAYFDLGTVFSLTEPVKEKLSETASPGAKPEIQVNAEKVHRLLGLEGDYLLMGYVGSSLYETYLECDDPRINPFSYPEVLV